NGNFVDAINYYEKSIAILENLEEIDFFDIGLAYNNLSTNYKKMGFFTARLNCLLKAKEFWEKDAENIDYKYFAILYGNLLRVYLEYGDVALAGKMLNKVDQLLAEEEYSISQAINQHRLHISFLAAVNNEDAAIKRIENFFTLF